MTEKFLFFIEEEYNINTNKKLFIKKDDKFTLSLYKLDKEDKEAYEELNDDYIYFVYLDVNGKVIEKVSKTSDKLITDIITSVFLINLPRGYAEKFEADIKLENLFKYFFFYIVKNHDFTFENFLDVASDNGWFSKKEAQEIYKENERFFTKLDKFILEDNFLIIYADEENFFAFE